MLAMSVLKFPQNVLCLRSLRPWEQNKTRLRAVLGFFAKPSCPQFLRRACLTLQLTGAVTSLTARKDTAHTHTPMLVRLFQGEAHDLVQTQLSDILGCMWRDPELEAGPATSALFATAMDLVLRPNQYRDYPCRLAGLCRRWCPDTYLTNILGFLQEPKENLDTGFSLELQRLARQQQSDMNAI